MCKSDLPPQVIHLPNLEDSPPPPPPPPPPPRPRTPSPPPKKTHTEIPIVKKTEHVHVHWHEYIPATHHHSWIYYDYVEPIVTKKWHRSIRELTYDCHDDWALSHCWQRPYHHWYPSHRLGHYHNTLFFDDHHHHFNSFRHHFSSHYLC